MGIDGLPGNRGRSSRSSSIREQRGGEDVWQTKAGNNNKAASNIKIKCIIALHYIMYRTVQKFIKNTSPSKTTGSLTAKYRILQ